MRSPKKRGRSGGKPNLQLHAAVLVLQELLRTDLQGQGAVCPRSLRKKLKRAAEQEKEADERRLHQEWQGRDEAEVCGLGGRE